ncbi:hypothetical protein [Acidovorax sp. Root219]|uniref:hypothetical protein n=1 Tax=Acidovorax sp. Root219 TaxID=1736493 RepID=UPI00070BCD2D|nr:hypothetical protein [Acidovorax sp. Root219]KRC20189.1 hypothetical protein ASE28_28280 [Acidovorax sp. Root219]
MNPTPAEMAATRQQYSGQQLETHGTQLAVIEQMWLELARALAAQGVLNAEALAQRLEAHAQRAPDSPVWFFGLTEVARKLRQSSSDPDSLVQ